MATPAQPEPQLRDHPVPCRGVHDLHQRPKTWDPGGYCPSCIARRAEEREQRILEREARDRALELADSMGGHQ